LFLDGLDMLDVESLESPCRNMPMDAVLAQLQLSDLALQSCNADAAGPPAAEPATEPAGVDVCASLPCQNGGTCDNAATDLSLEGDAYSCTCAVNPVTQQPMHWGVNCETSEDDCTRQFGGDPCAAQVGTTCTDCARYLPSPTGFGQGASNPACPMGYTCEAAAAGPLPEPAAYTDGVCP